MASWFGSGDSRSSGRQNSFLVTLTAVILFPGWLAAAAAPIIDSFTASSATVAPGGLVTFTVEAHDPDCAGTCTSGCGQYLRADLTAWSATGGTFVSEDDGVSASPYTAGAIWEAPTDEASYTITVILSDSGTFMCGGRSSASAELTVQVTSSTNQAPTVDSLTAAPVQLYPQQPSSLTCVGSDPDGDSLTYDWSSDGGTLSPGSDGSATFQAPVPGIFAITCTVADPGGFTGSADINLSVTDAFPETNISSGITAPRRLDLDSMGDLFVVDRSNGIAVFNAFTEEIVYRIPLPGVTSVAVDWADRLLIGTTSGAWVADRDGQARLFLNPLESLGGVSDVAVDRSQLRYVVLYGNTSRVVVFDTDGLIVGAFGTTGDGAEQMKSPNGVAVTPLGEILVADTGHGEIKVFDSDGNWVRSFGGLGGGAGEFVRVDDVAVDELGIIYTTDTFQDWVQTFEPNGDLREVLGTHGEDVGQFMTPTGILPSNALKRLYVCSLNASRLEVFRLDGTPPEPALPVASASPQSLVFDTQAVGSTSDPQGVLLMNDGTAPLGIQKLSVAGDFIESNDCGSFLDPGMSCSFEVSFSPESVGMLVGALNVETNDAEPLVVDLRGEGFASATIQVAPTSLDFGDAELGETSPAQAVSVTNGGTVPLTITDVRITANFNFSSNCPGSLDGGASCTIDVFFSPAAVGDTILGTLTVETSNGTANVALEGRSIAWDLGADPAAIDFGTMDLDTATPPQTVRVSNVGTQSVVVHGVTLAGASPTHFGIDFDHCTALRLEVGESCELGVFFHPKAEGTFTADIHIASSATDSPDVVTLEGIGEDMGALFSDGFETGDLSAWSGIHPVIDAIVPLTTDGPEGPVTVTFGQHRPGVFARAAEIAVINRTADPVDVDPLLFENMASYTVVSDGCSGQRLEAGKACMLRIALTGGASGPSKARITVASTAATRPYVIELQIRGRARRTRTP